MSSVIIDMPAYGPGQAGSRPPGQAVPPVIIDAPSLQSLRQKYAFSAVTLVFWALWFYLWLPLVSALAWLFGVETIYQYMIVLDGYQAFLELLGWYALTVLLIGISLVGWALYNQVRFRGKERRLPHSPLKNGDIAPYFGVGAPDLSAWQHASRLVIQYDEDGRIKGVVTQ